MITEYHTDISKIEQWISYNEKQMWSRNIYIPLKVERTIEGLFFERYEKAE